ncbi:hypothetical protein BD309DRAFT_657829 [Dichomitus squalens]|nr:hypothetical protein BD309DRAFT_657829 [Dichomitus squalens]
MAFGVTSNLHLCMIHWGVLSCKCDARVHSAIGYKIRTGTYLAGTLCSEAILLVRTGAIWGWSKYIILLLGGGVASILLFCFYVVYTSNIHVQFPPESMMRMTGCIAADTEVWPAFVGMCLGEIGEHQAFSPQAVSAHSSL